MKRFAFLVVLGFIGLWSSQAFAEQELRSVNPELSGGFGTAVYVDGRVAFITASGEGTSGFLHIFEFDNPSNQWNFHQSHEPSDNPVSAAFGRSVAADGDFAIVGTPSISSAYVFERDPATNQWAEKTKLTETGGFPGTDHGISVAVSGDIAIVGAPKDDGPPVAIGIRGAAYVYVRDPGTEAWSKEAVLTPSDPTDNFFGESVDLLGEIAVVGARGEFVDNGSAYVFIRDAATGTWSEQARLTASDGVAGDFFGRSVSIGGGFVAVGAPSRNNARGAVYVFVRNPVLGAWDEQAIIPNNDLGRSNFGRSVSLDGASLLIGVPIETNGPGSAHLYDFNPATTTWELVDVFVPGDSNVPVNDDDFGLSVSLSGGTALVGAPDHDHGVNRSGSAYSFRGFETQITQFVLGVDSSVDALYEIDLSDGQTSLIGPLHPDVDRYITPIAMAIRPSDNVVFVWNNSPTEPISDRGLSTVDPTGTATRVGGSEIRAALAFDLMGNLYGIAGFGRLATVDPATGAETSLGGPILPPQLFGLDFNPSDGLLYGITNTNVLGDPVELELLKINPINGNLLSSIPLSGTFGGSAPGTLIFDVNGRLHGTVNASTDNLFEINPLTGAVSNFRTVTSGFIPQGMGISRGNTPTGTNVSVRPSGPTTGTSPVIITFSNVVTLGQTSLETSTSGPPPPSGFQLGDPPTYYDISTTAGFSGPVEVCIDYSGISVTDEANLKLFHFEGGSWVDVTTLLNTVNDIICGSVTSFSLFVIAEPNRPPNCSSAAASPDMIWPPNHKLVNVEIVGVTDPDGDPVTISITKITQDEPVNGQGGGNFEPDGAGVGTPTAQVRAERAGSGNGRVYEISFVADDGKGGECPGSVKVCMPHDKGKKGSTCIDDGQLYDSVTGTALAAATKPVVAAKPALFSVENFPNPFNPSTTIRYDLTEPTDVRIAIYNAMGQQVEMLVNQHQAEGRYEVVWDATRFSSGIYLFVIETGGARKAMKMMLLK